MTINGVPATDRLPEPFRRCVEQSIAAEALEGWRPTADDVDALAALASDDITFDDYLASCRARYPTRPVKETTGRMPRRAKPYLIPGTTVLRNNFGAESHRVLASLEFACTAGRMVRCHRRLADGDIGVGDLDVRALHRELFGDAYAWAGDFRVTELRVGDEAFARRSSVRRKTEGVEAAARALVTDVAPHHNADALAGQLAGLYADYNFVHPFREGNGRTGTMMLHIVATLRGRRLDLSRFSREEWYEASRNSMLLRDGSGADFRPFLPLVLRALD